MTHFGEPAPDRKRTFFCCRKCGVVQRTHMDSTGYIWCSVEKTHTYGAEEVAISVVAR